MPLTPIIAVHATAAILAIATGPIAHWARKGREQRPRPHRAFGYAWVTLMLIMVLSAIAGQCKACTSVPALGLVFSHCCRGGIWATSFSTSGWGWFKAIN